MNPISAFFVRNIVVVFFFYGLAFFVMGLALAFASRQGSEFKFARAIRPLAAFGILHGLHEWYEMFQKIANLTSGYVPAVWDETIRLAILVLSLLMLLVFGVSLLSPQKPGRLSKYGPVAGMLVLWMVGVGLIGLTLKPPMEEMIAAADALARYSLGVPGALVGTWALMAQQRTFREHDMPQFGRDLVWCAAALFLYGVIGQIFVRQSLLFPSMYVNSMLFLQWFGIPVQLFRGVMAAILTFYMVRALRAFELESQQRLEAAHQARLNAQAAALEAERRISQQMEHLNEELRLTTRELSMLLDLSNLLATPMSLQDRLRAVLERIVESMHFPEAGMIILAGEDSDSPQVTASFGFSNLNGRNGPDPYNLARDLGEQSVGKEMVLCRHLDGAVLEFLPEEALRNQECRHYPSPTTMISLPLATQNRVIGSVVLVQTEAGQKSLPFEEFKLIMGIAHQLGLSVENARLYQEAQSREKILAELLHQVVGAQEAERKRIARELHDATGQSLTAMTLGLRGIANVVANISPAVAEQIEELRSFGTNALKELRHIIANLRPSQLDDLGLIAALEWYVQEFEDRYAVPVDFVTEGEAVRLPSEYETVLFRITQEALTNIAKHAEASQVTITLKASPTRIVVTIIDDGRGFDPKKVLRDDGKQTGWGLLGIVERTLLLGGDYKIDSTPGEGTRIKVRIPLVMEKEDVKEENTTVTG